MKYLRFVLLCVFSLVCSGMVYSQDSVQVFVIGGGVDGEKFRFYYKDRKVLNFKVDGNFKYEFKIPMEKGWQYGSSIPLFIYRKGRFGLFYRNVVPAIYYDDAHKYLIFERDYGRKNRFPLEFSWSNMIPLND